MSARRLLSACACALCALCALASAQTESKPQPPSAQGEIKGRVIGDDGQPLAGAQIYARSLRNQFSGAVSAADGKFILPNLERGTYTLNTHAPGYYDDAGLQQERGLRTYYHPGDTVTLRLAKGGVITGRVRDAAGEPLIAIRVRVVRVRDEAGRTPGQPVFNLGPPEATTDDRGIYRLYGLPPGTYVVVAGGQGRFGGGGRPTAYDDDAPTFYPSTTREGAAEVVVQSGQEATDIDIRYRGEAGHAASGTVEVAGAALGDGDSVSLQIMTAGSLYITGYRYLSGRAGERSFVFDGLADGDYDVIAERYSNSDGRAAAASQRISVRGADVTGLKLVLAPLAAIAGRVVLEAAPPAAATWKEQCQSKLDAGAGEITIIARREPDKRADAAYPGGAKLADAAPDDKNEFALRGLAPGRFHLDVRPPGPDWYISTAALASATPAAANTAGAKPNAPAARPANNPLTDGLTLAAGAQVNGLTLTLAPGAAALHGRVVPAAEGTSLPDLQIYLVPAEPARADEALRYVAARVRTDGTFAFTHLAPGRYHLLTRPAAPREPGADDALASVYPDVQTRTQLRRDAEPTETLELQPCQRLADYQLRLRPQ